MTVTSTRLQTCFKTQQLRSREGSPFTLQERHAGIDACLALIKENYTDITRAIEADFGNRARGMTLMYDIFGSITSLEHSRKHMGRWMRGERRPTPFPFNLTGASVRVEYQPKGVVGILGTWNFPLFTMFSPLAQVVAAGNRAILKPSDLVPHLAHLLCELAPRYLDEDRVALVEGDRSVAEEFSRLPFDHLVLTGGAEVGKAVMAASAGNLTPLTLELGGKSPVILGRTAKIPMAAERIVFAKVINSGQMCVAPDYVLVHAEALEEFIAACQEAYRRTYEHCPSEAGSIINQRHYERVQSCLEDARQGNARIISLADIAEPKEHSMPLHLVVDPPLDSLLARHEIFGPVLNIVSYQSIDDAIAHVNGGDKPLALYYFGKDAKEQRKVLDNTRSGGVTLNNIARHPGVEDAPFGGIGASGMGHYHGREGFLEFSQARTVFTEGWFDISALFGMRAPFGKKLEKQLEARLKR